MHDGGYNGSGRIIQNVTCGWGSALRRCESGAAGPRPTGWMAFWTSRGRAPLARITDADAERVVTVTLETLPKNAAHWSTRSMTAASVLIQTAVARIWRLQPHRAETFKLSKDRSCVVKVRGIVGLCLTPPDRAMVLWANSRKSDNAGSHRKIHPAARRGAASDTSRLAAGSFTSHLNGAHPNLVHVVDNVGLS